ncbi:unnamed protein product [Amoebophrya sp. A120]|nr:unnamed protein product [Amoebophrya sp. A120]|eukprot:GSA120T00022458001.1
MGACGGKEAKPAADSAPAAEAPKAETATPPQMEAGKVTDAHSALLVKAFVNMADAEVLKSCCTEDAWMSPPGAPKFSIEEMSGMLAGYKGTFPDWVSLCPADKITFVSETDTEVVYKVFTQQNIGLMKADLPAMGPFPACTMDEAPARPKETPTVMPFESGLVTVNKEKGLIVSGAWTGELGEEAGATTMDFEPKVGMVMLYEKLLGLKMPEPPAAEEAKAE